MQPAPRHALVLVIASLTAGCAVGPAYVPPRPVVPERYMGQDAVARRQVAVEADLATWWTAFGDAQLSHFVALSLEKNLDLAQAHARVSQARAGVQAAQAALAPAGQLTGQAARAYQSVETPLGQVLSAPAGFDRYGSAYEANVGVSWEWDVFGGLRRGRQAANADYEATEAGAVAARLAVAAQTADVYITIRGVQARAAIARQQVRTQEELLGIVQKLHAKGLAPELQVRQIEGALAQVRAGVLTLDAATDVATNALDVMVGVTPGTYRSVVADARPIPSAPRIEAAGLPEDLLRRRPDLMAAERRLAAANGRVGVALAEYYPKFSLAGMVGSATSLSGGHLFGGGASQAAGVLGLRWRVFDFNRIDAQIKAAQGHEAELLAAYRLAVLRAVEDVEAAFTQLVSREEQAKVLAEGVQSLGRARGASFAAYQGGVVSLIEVLQADDSLLRASDARAQAQTESARAAVAAFKALGGGWQPSALVASTPP
jgi:NodT family efflux transporter outer membrane factor (OMF) lipoprotein